MICSYLLNLKVTFKDYLMRVLKLVLIMLLGITPIYGQKIVDNNTEYKKDCSNCKFILSEASKAYKINYEEALKENIEIHNYVKKLIDLDEIYLLKLKAEKAYMSNIMEKYYTYFENIKSISTKYISDFEIKTKGDAYIFIDLKHVENDTLRYNIYVDSGVKYGSIRIYYNLQTGQLAHIKADESSYKSFMKNKNKKAENINIWLFKDYEILAYMMNIETKADKDFVNICENFIEYKTYKTSNNLILVNAKKTTTTSVSLSFKNCN